MNRTGAMRHTRCRGIDGVFVVDPLYRNSAFCVKILHSFFLIAINIRFGGFTERSKCGFGKEAMAQCIVAGLDGNEHYTR